ncbi:hypothetical protein B0H13DRAFT_1891793 [Mycena leptocephala]|nr:hypothetical protein B0H13DRAFT_1891793 [Mycena leptocephala]
MSIYFYSSELDSVQGGHSTRESRGVGGDEMARPNCGPSCTTFPNINSPRSQFAHRLMFSQAETAGAKRRHVLFGISTLIDSNTPQVRGKVTTETKHLCTKQRKKEYKPFNPRPQNRHVDTASSMRAQLAWQRQSEGNVPMIEGSRNEMCVVRAHVENYKCGSAQVDASPGICCTDIPADSTVPDPTPPAGTGPMVRKFDLKTPARITEFIEWSLQLHKESGTMPFHWKQWGDGIDKQGLFQSDVILYVFAYHLSSFPAKCPWLTVHPVGPLLLAVQAVQF